MSLHSRAEKIVTDLVSAIGPFDQQVQTSALEAIKKLALDAYNHGRTKADAWDAVSIDPQTTNSEFVATAAVTRKHALLARTIADQEAAVFNKPQAPYDYGVVTNLMPGSVSNEAHRIAIGFLAYLLLCGTWHSRAGFVWLETMFGTTGAEAGFYVFDLQKSYLRVQSENSIDQTTTP